MLVIIAALRVVKRCRDNFFRLVRPAAYLIGEVIDMTTIAIVVDFFLDSTKSEAKSINTIACDPSPNIENIPDFLANFARYRVRIAFPVVIVIVLNHFLCPNELSKVQDVL